ncbi:helix-turn-helix transcriptional regulator [Mesorhizobium sp.]|uniref:helix-turn-helix domain-containing protein n=1 Tax=Mesorhizobium sp. TaxID=1871066 RepID=UPI0012149A15|nr:helix-turn-helix transcriptional regulator [Mesorhizobium sp.]TIN08972.1 MAG: helix-turn-helix transcriptional regulator [Mesorhizobium sp.]TIN76669.1 MAG: helix-turn-helix transcriptional regulator [Mesorhizobium sp.]
MSLATSSDQLRAARALLGLSQPDVAAAANVSSMTVKRAEGSGKPAPSADAVKAIRRALESAGIEFIPENGGGTGVRLRKGGGGGG